MLKSGKILPSELEIIKTADTPVEAARIIVEAHNARNGLKAG
jgi:hypothetical protein